MTIYNSGGRFTLGPGVSAGFSTTLPGGNRGPMVVLVYPLPGSHQNVITSTTTRLTYRFSGDIETGHTYLFAVQNHSNTASTFTFAFLVD
jgi:hypothetical protein